jgi:Tfp pilus assembly protein PilX
MLFKPTQTKKNRGSILIITVMMLAVMGFVLASYLTLVGNQNRSIERSQTWNSVIPLVEAGLEEAMVHLNQNGVTNLFNDDWDNFLDMAVKRRTLAQGRYVTAITVESRPVIECTAYVPAPAILTHSSAGTFFGSIGLNQIIRKKGDVYRSVRVTTGGGALFGKGMVAKGGIDMNGNNVATDSFDSADPNFSTAGRYDSSKRKDNGDVATNSRQAGMFNAGNANIMGKVATGPGGSVILGANGVVGSATWVSGGNSGIEPGRFSDDMNMSFPSIKVPFTGGWTPGGGTISLTNVSYGSNQTTVTTLPSPLPGVVATNYGVVTATTYPDGVIIGAVVTNYIPTTSTAYPDNPFGAVTTNSMVLVTNSLPSPLPDGTITSNSVTLTNASLPSPTPTGTIITNTAFSSILCPLNPMPDGPPADPPTWTPPGPGTYVGVVTNRYKNTGANASRGWYHDYNAISTYVYNAKTYAYTIPVSYSYTSLSYTYNAPVSYTYSEPCSTNITVQATTYDYVLNTGNYVVDTLSGTTYVRGNAVLYVRSSISISGKGGITIAPGASLQIYMGGESASIAGQGVMNYGGYARNFMYYGLDSNTSLSLSGNSQFSGVIYAPNAAFHLNGGGNNTTDFIGASVANSVSMNGHFNFHYDEDLARNGPRSRYTVTSWNELGPDDTRILSIMKYFYPYFDNGYY